MIHWTCHSCSPIGKPKVNLSGDTWRRETWENSLWCPINFHNMAPSTSLTTHWTLSSMLSGTVLLFHLETLRISHESLTSSMVRLWQSWDTFGSCANLLRKFYSLLFSGTAWWLQFLTTKSTLRDPGEDKLDLQVLVAPCCSAGGLKMCGSSVWLLTEWFWIARPSYTPNPS